LEHIEKKDDLTLLRRIMTFLRGDRRKDAKQEIQEILDEVEEKGIIDEDQGEMIENIIVLKDTTVREMIVPKADMAVVESTKGLFDVIDVMNASGYSIIPVYEKNVDNIVGIVRAKDILKYCRDSLATVPISTVMRPAYFVPEGKRLTDLLREFKEKQCKMAFVIDEYGNVDGLTTLDDILIEIFGDVSGDDQNQEYVIDRGDGTFQVDPTMSIYEFAETFAVEIPEGDYDTVGGFITSRLERIPKPGESFKHGDMLFEVVGADKKRISRLIVHPPAGSAA